MLDQWYTVSGHGLAKFLNYLAKTTLFQLGSLHMYTQNTYSHREGGRGTVESEIRGARGQYFKMTIYCFGVYKVN